MNTTLFEIEIENINRFPDNVSSVIVKVKVKLKVKVIECTATAQW